MLKRFLFITFFLLGALSANCQEGDTVRLQAHYIATFKSFFERKDIETEEKVLRIADHHSEFYGRWQRRRSEIVDSTMKTNCSVSETLSLINKYPRPRQFYAIYDNYPSQGMRIVTDKEYKTFSYQEKIEPIRWQILPRDTVVLDTPCQFATAMFRGRLWTACFAPSIPFQSGPWKLRGLPGLILYARDDTGMFSFDCIEIKKGEGLLQAPSLKKTIPTTREKFRKIRLEATADPEGYIKRRFGLETKGWGPDGKPLVRKKFTPIFMEK